MTDSRNVLLIIGGTILVLSLFGWALGDEQRISCGFWDTLDWCLDNIMEQNESIIEKLDWQNCVLLANQSYGYQHNTSGLTITVTDINNLCGEMP